MMRRAHELTSANRESHLIRAKKLLRQFPASAVDFIFFADDTIFSVAPPVNLQIDRSDCVYVPEKTRKRDVAADHGAANQLLGTGPT